MRECSDVRFQDKLRLIVTPQTMWSKWRHNDTAFHHPQLYLQDDIASVMSFFLFISLALAMRIWYGKEEPFIEESQGDTPTAL